MYFIEVEPYKPRLLNLLADPGMNWFDAFVMRFADLQIKEAIPVIKKLLKRKNLNFVARNELEAALETLETGHIAFPEYAQPYVKERDPWRKHYQAFEKQFFSDYEPEESPLAKKAREGRESQRLLDENLSPKHKLPKIGRNEKVNVRYTDSKEVISIKFKKVEEDLLNGRCELI